MIQLYNRDGANLYLEKIREIEPNISEWCLKVDGKHEYCLNYMRVIFEDNNVVIGLDPSGGPYLALGDELDYFPKYYKIVKITNDLTLWLSEGNNNN